MKLLDYILGRHKEYSYNALYWEDGDGWSYELYKNKEFIELNNMVYNTRRECIRAAKKRLRSL